MKTQNSKMQSLKEVTAISYTPPLHIPEQAGCTLQIIIDDLKLSMKLAGAASLTELGPHWVVR